MAPPRAPVPVRGTRTGRQERQPRAGSANSWDLCMDELGRIHHPHIGSRWPPRHGCRRRRPGPPRGAGARWRGKARGFPSRDPSGGRAAAGACAKGVACGRTRSGSVAHAHDARRRRRRPIARNASRQALVSSSAMPVQASSDAPPVSHQPTPSNPSSPHGCRERPAPWVVSTCAFIGSGMAGSLATAGIVQGRCRRACRMKPPRRVGSLPSRRRPGSLSHKRPGQPPTRRAALVDTVQSGQCPKEHHMGSGNKVHTIPVLLQARGRERRAAERVQAQMPMTVDGREGMTSDLSATGLSFHAEQRYEVGASIDVVIEYLLDGHHYPLHCQAEVVRVRPAEGGYAVGARLAPQSQLLEVPVPATDPLPR
ncbi:MAG: PilZ domain-containing protein [Comamonadaceae bacterium]|nr:MAG: PilZ domain-containing protein [Comamonadaceae bacterium]